MNWFGPALGMATLFIIGLGLVWVIRGERRFGHLWWPYVLGAGLAAILASLLIRNDWGSALLGVAGASMVWGATELKDQAVRAELGWYPFGKHKIEPPFAGTIRNWPAPHL